MIERSPAPPAPSPARPPWCRPWIGLCARELRDFFRPYRAALEIRWQHEPGPAS